MTMTRICGKSFFFLFLLFFFVFCCNNMKKTTDTVKTAESFSPQTFTHVSLLVCFHTGALKGNFQIAISIIY